MGVNYSQHVIVGREFRHEDLLVVESEAVYEMQPRYDTRTGNKTSEVKVLVKQRVAYFVFKDIRHDADDPYGFAEEVAEKYGCFAECDRDEEVFYIGIKLVQTDYDYGNVDLINDEVSLEDIKSAFKKAKKIVDSPSLVFFGIVS